MARGHGPCHGRGFPAARGPAIARGALGLVGGRGHAAPRPARLRLNAWKASERAELAICTACCRNPPLRTEMKRFIGVSSM